MQSSAAEEQFFKNSGLYGNDEQQRKEGAVVKFPHGLLYQIGLERRCEYHDHGNEGQRAISDAKAKQGVFQFKGLMEKHPFTEAFSVFT